MGQRHQLFVIAKVGKRHRCLAAMHHQWLYGSRATEVAARLRLIFQCPANRRQLEFELLEAKSKSEQFWNDASKNWRDEMKNGESTLSVPFPYVMTCLIVGASFDSKTNYNYSMPHVLPFGMPFGGGDNNDGITVLDISDLSKVKYCMCFLYEIPCFDDDNDDYEEEEEEEDDDEGIGDDALAGRVDLAALDELHGDDHEQSDDDDEDDVDMGGHDDEEHDDEVSQFTPLSGAQYEAAYNGSYPRRKPADDDLIIDIETLNSAWPDSRWHVENSAVPYETDSDSELDEESAPQPDQSTSRTFFTRLLSRVFEERIPFPDEMKQKVIAYREGKPRALSMPGIDMNLQQLQWVLSNIPSMRELCFQSTTIDDIDLQVAKSAAHLDMLYSSRICMPAFNSIEMVPWTPRLLPPPAMSCMSPHYWPIAQVIHGMAMNYTQQPVNWSLQGKDTTGNHMLAFPTTDISFMGSQWLTGLRHFMAFTLDWMGFIYGGPHGTLGGILAKSLASSSDTLDPAVLDDPNHLPIRPLPSFLYSMARSMCAHSGTPIFRSVTPPAGQWTLVLLDELGEPTPKLHELGKSKPMQEEKEIKTRIPSYCFLRSKDTTIEADSPHAGVLDPSQFELHDFQSFLATLPVDDRCLQGRTLDDVRREQLDFWNRHILRDTADRRSEQWQLCTHETVRQVLIRANLRNEEEQRMRDRFARPPPRARS